MPLPPRQLSKSDYQDILNKIDALVAGCKGLLLTKEGHLVLLKSVLSSILTHMITVYIGLA